MTSSIQSLSFDDFQSMASLPGSKFAPLSDGDLVNVVASDSAQRLCSARVRLAVPDESGFLFLDADWVSGDDSADHPALAVAHVFLDGALRVTHVDKSLCTACSFMVKVLDHESRCNLRSTVASEAKASSRSLAWVGDALLTTDVRVCLLLDGVPLAEVQIRAAGHIANETLAGMYDSLSATVQPRTKALGLSVKQRATAFEASYAFDFRRRYLHVVFGRTPEQVASYLATFYLGEPVGDDAASCGGVSLSSAGLP